MKNVQRRSYFWPVFSSIRLNTEKCGPEITPYLDNFHAVCFNSFRIKEFAIFAFSGVNEIGFDFNLFTNMSKVKLFSPLRTLLLKINSLAGRN